MAAAAVPFAAGILLSFGYDAPAPLWGAAAALFALVAAVVLRSGRPGAGVPLCAALFAAGAMRGSADTLPQPPYGERLVMTLRFEQPAALHGGHSFASARLLRCEGFDSRRAPRLYVRGDTQMRFSRGDEIDLRGVIRPFGDDKGSGFAAAARRRGYAGSVWASPDMVLGFRPAARTTLHERAVDKLSRLLPDSSVRSTLLPMTAGERLRTGDAVRQTYARGGVAHLLAVSGLHAGIVFMIAGALLGLVPALYGGNIVRSIAAILAVWLYVAVCGYPPSAVRAAAMLSVLQLSLLGSRAYSGVNALAATAAVMLAVAPRLVFDIGFRLSFIAVAAILLWGVPLWRRLHTRCRPINALISTLAAGAAATAATMPTVSNAFGLVSFIGLALNPIAALLAGGAIFFSVAALCLPFTIASRVIAPACALARMLDALAARAAALPWGSMEYRLSDGAEAAIYAAFVAATLAVWGFTPPPRPAQTPPPSFPPAEEQAKRVS